MKYLSCSQETVMKNRRCAPISAGDMSKATGIHRSTVAFALKRLRRKKLIEIDDTQKTNIALIILGDFTNKLLTAYTNKHRLLNYTSRQYVVRDI